MHCKTLGRKGCPRFATTQLCTCLHAMHWQVGSNPVWFRSMMLAEIVFQLPCFLLLIYGISARVSQKVAVMGVNATNR